jgi:flagellar M-ring protein FliF
MPFESTFGDISMPQPSVVDRVYPLLPLIRYALLAIATLMVYLIFLRPLVRILRGAGEQTAPVKTVEELENELRGQSSTPLLGGPGDPLAQIRQEVLGGDMFPVQVVKNWLRQEPAES